MDIGAGLAIGGLHLAQSAGVIDVLTTLSCRAFLRQSAGATLTVGSGDRLILTSAAVFGGAVTGAGTVVVSNALVSGLSIGGATTFWANGTVTQPGALTLGDGSANAATLSIGLGATWRIGAGSIVRGAAAGSRIIDSGLLIKNSGGGVSMIGAAVTDSGAVEAAVGTLDLTQAIFGGGSLKIDANAALEVDAAAAGALTATFAGTNARLALKAPTSFAATIAGFAVGDVIDLLGKAATGASLDAKDRLVVVNGSVTVATLQLAGAYTTPTFTTSSDGHGGTDVALQAPAHVTPPAAAFPGALIAAIASLGASPASSSSASMPVDAARPTLLAPRGL